MHQWRRIEDEAIEDGAEIVSYDRDFARFPGIRHRHPG